MGFRFEATFPDGRPMAVMEEEEDLDTGAIHLVTTFCHYSVTAERHKELEAEAFAGWLRHLR